MCFGKTQELWILVPLTRFYLEERAGKKTRDAVESKAIKVIEGPSKILEGWFCYIKINTNITIETAYLWKGWWY